MSLGFDLDDLAEGGDAVRQPSAAFLHHAQQAQRSGVRGLALDQDPGLRLRLGELPSLHQGDHQMSTKGVALRVQRQPCASMGLGDVEIAG